MVGVVEHDTCLPTMQQVVMEGRTFVLTACQHLTRAAYGAEHESALGGHPAQNAHIDTDALDLVSRSFGSEYIRSHDRFEVPRPTWAGLKADGKV